MISISVSPRAPRRGRDVGPSASRRAGVIRRAHPRSLAFRSVDLRHVDVVLGPLFPVGTGARAVDLVLSHETL